MKDGRYLLGNLSWSDLAPDSLAPASPPTLRRCFGSYGSCASLLIVIILMHRTTGISLYGLCALHNFYRHNAG